MEFEAEEFRPIKNYPGYFVSNMGRVRKGNDKILSTPTNSKGYTMFVAMLNGKRASRMLHRVIAEAFLGDIKGMEVDHLDMDKTNNRLENLEIVSRKENMRRFHRSDAAKEAAKKISQSKIEYWSTRKTDKSQKQKDPMKIHGGRRSNQNGRPRLPPGEKRVKVAITMTPAHYAATAGNRSATIEQALDQMLGPDAEKGKE